MNRIEGTIREIEVDGSLSLVQVSNGEVVFSAIVIETPETAPYLKPGNSIHVIFKETEVIIGKGADIPVSLQNKLTGTVLSVEPGKLLSKIIINTLTGPVASVITTNAVTSLDLRAGDEVTAMIKTNEIMLAP